MSFWKRLFGKRRSPSPDCPFCTGQETPAESIGPLGYAVWKCPCGAIASGAWAPDLDDLADQLLQMLDIDQTVREPMMPTGHPAIRLQRYDANKVRRGFRELLRGRGFEFRSANLEAQGHEMEVFWVKRDYKARQGEQVMQHENFSNLFLPYELGAPLGSGGEGWVFETRLDAEATRLHGPTGELALKIGRVGGDAAVRLASASGPRQPGRFCAKGLYYMTGSYEYRTTRERDASDALWRQYRRLAGSRNALLPRVVQFSTCQGVPWYVMERFGGTDMRTLLQSCEVSTSACICLLGKLLEEIVAQRHSDPLFWHGDLKPENIIVVPGGRCRLIDPAIGFAFAEEWSVGRTLTVQYNPLGLAGEQSDTFSLATIAMELLTGEHPFREVRCPLLEYCYSDLHSGMTPAEKRAAIETHLDLERATIALPKRLRGLFSSWFLHPPTYGEMLGKWQDLGSTV